MRVRWESKQKAHVHAKCVRAKTSKCDVRACDGKITLQITNRMTAPMMLKTGPNNILRGPVNNNSEHQTDPTIPKYQEIKFIAKFSKFAIAPDAESKEIM